MTSSNSELVAVIGMSGRFPGASDVNAFWRNLRAGVESIHAFTDDELLASGESRENLSNPSYVKACGRLEGIDLFDAHFFGMSPRDAALFDPQHRLFLECACEAFDDAGHVGAKGPGPVGVFACAGPNEYFTYNLVRNRQVMDSVGPWLIRHTGNDASFLATRVSYTLDLRGPSMSVQTACSSSLLAIHLACQSLLAGECDLALAGGSTVYPEQNRGYVHRKGEILSQDGHCRAFDAKASGTVMSSAVGCVILRRLEDARRDGDRILAVILGSAANNDGSGKVGYLGPSVDGQARVIREALSIAGVRADDVTYVEAHGTGTAIGDPIEIAALTDAFGPTSSTEPRCAIGSVKTNIGHAGEASGICGFLKTVLAIAHRELPASLHYEEPNPRIDFAASPFYVNDRLREWVPSSGGRRIAGVTSLGVGGTNVHVIVAEDDAPSAPSRPSEATPNLIVLSAKTPTALERVTAGLVAVARTSPELSCADVSHTLLSGRRAFPYRRAVVASDLTELAELLEAGDPNRVVNNHYDGTEVPRVVFMFPGGGSQFGGMGADLYRSERVYRDAIDECLGGLDVALEETLRGLLLAGAEAASERLEAPSLSLPALFATEYALASLLASWGILPSAMVGHSAGEYVCACLAGTLSASDGTRIAALRGKLFETLPEGSMLGVAISEESAASFVGGEISLAAVNGPELCVFAGPTAAVAELAARLRASGIASSRVPFRVAAHSSVVEPILAEFETFLRTIRLSPPRLPFVSNATATWIADADATDPAYWSRHLRSTVRFRGGLDAVLERSGAILVEVGPGRALAGFARHTAPKSTLVFTTMPKRQPGAEKLTLLGALGHLWAHGVVLDDAGARGEVRRRRVALPTYPFERKRHWIDPDPVTPDVARPARQLLLDDENESASSAERPVAEQSCARDEARSPIEKYLVTLWQEFLGVEKVDVHDDFFDLGGQSLLAVRIFQRVAEKYGVDLPLATLLEAPTIARCAALIEASKPAALATPPFEPLVLVQPGGAATPFFCVHGAGGNVLNLRDIAAAMGHERDFYGLQAHGVDGVTDQLHTIEEMARAYLPSVRARQGEGPYLLGGYSGGGLVALEMAQQLEREGHEVGLLALIDTLHPQVPLRGLTMGGRVVRLREQGLRYVAEGIARRRDRRRRVQDLAEIARHRARGKPVPFSLRDLDQTTHFDSAAWKYRPDPWRGRVILFRATEVAYIYGGAGRMNGWERDLLGEIHVVPVGGDHATLVLGAGANVIASSILAILAVDDERRALRAVAAGDPPRVATLPLAPAMPPSLGFQA
jgi:acyl transferase domain-containing protein/thioesterase domain-containing protein